jgi:two-component system, CitB family, sensor kinase
MLTRRHVSTTMESLPAAPARVRIAVLLVLQCAIVLVCVLATTLIAFAVQERSIRAATEERVLDVAQSLAELDQVQRAVLLDRSAATAELQPLADVLENASGVDYVVVTDADGIRLTHPTADERGLPVSTDATDVLAGATFVGTETGTIGPTLRAKVPVFAGSTVIGTASVGILESRLAQSFEEAAAGLLPWVVGSIVVGMLLSAGVVAILRRRVRRLEADARELDTQRRVAAALRDQTHEFHTRLHVIRGLVADGAADDALAYIGGISPVSSEHRMATVDDPTLRALLEGCAAELAERGGSLEVDERSAAARGAVGEDELLVVANLVRNAIEAAGAGGRVHVLVHADDARVTVDVADDGPGVPAGEVERIFQRGVSSKAAGGRGVGLDLVRRIVAGRNGTVTVGASAWGGARFTVELSPALAAR